MRQSPPALCVNKTFHQGWYGSDGAALSNNLLNDSEASDFAIRVNFPNPTFGLDTGASLKWAPMMERIKAITGSNPDAFALAMYDAAWVAAQTLAPNKNRMDFAFFKQEFPEVVGSFFGTTGWTALNSAGDRRFGDYDFWAIRIVDGIKQQSIIAMKLKKRFIVSIVHLCGNCE